MKLLVLNGPNLNMLGIREKHLYGAQTYEDLQLYILKKARELGLDVDIFQSNHEGALIDEVQRAGAEMDAIVINGGAYSHTSLALADALRAVSVPAIEVHISNIFAREPIRQHSLLAPACLGIIVGMGLDGYRLAIEALLGHD